MGFSKPTELYSTKSKTQCMSLKKKKLGGQGIPVWNTDHDKRI